MITKIKNSEGKECFAIVLNEHASYEDITAMQAAIINILQAATHSDLFQAFADEVYDLLNLLLETLPNDTQSLTYQMAVFPKNNN